MLLRQFLDGSRNRKSLSREKRQALWKQAHGQCWYCGVAVPKTAFILEHVNPRSRGGANSQGNLVVSCWGCDREKGTMNLEEFRAHRGVVTFHGELKRPMNNIAERQRLRQEKKRLKYERRRRMQREVRLMRIVNMADAFSELGLKLR